MKKLIFALLFLLSISLTLLAQGGIPTIPKDLNGFSIKANNIRTKTDSTLYIADYIYI